LVLIFKNFGMENNNSSLHFLRAYHLIDVLKCTTQEEVEKALLCSTEFSQSEKSKGIFFYHEKIKVEEEEEPEKPTVTIPEMPPEEAVEEAPPLATSTQEAPVEEIPPPEAREGTKEVRVEAPFEPLEAEIAEKEKIEEPLKPKREKITKKRRVKIEAERVPRARKGEKRYIEEKIELEESEQEALLALKTKEKKEAKEEKAKAPPKEKKKEFKRYVSEEPAFGFFAEKLKTALDKTKKEKK